MTIAVDLGRKATKQTNKHTSIVQFRLLKNYFFAYQLLDFHILLLLFLHTKLLCHNLLWVFGAGFFKTRQCVKQFGSRSGLNCLQRLSADKNR